MIKSRIFYIAALIGLALFYIYCNSYTPLFIIIIFAVLTVFGVVCVFLSKKKLHLTLSPTQPFMTQSADGSAEFSVKVINESLIPISAVTFEIEFRDMSEDTSVKRKIRTPAAAKEERQIYTVISTSHSACIVCTLGNVRIYDPLGIISVRLKNISDRAKVLITPIMASENYREPVHEYYTLDSDKFSDTQKGDDPSQVFEIRDYVPGDDVRRIHWRLSARQDNPMVKEYSKPVDDDCLIMLETGIGGGSPEEKKNRSDALLSVFMKLSSEILGNEQGFRVFWYSGFSGNLVSFDVGTFEDISPIIEKYLSEQLSEKKNATLEAAESEFQDFFGKQAYYLYNSSCFDKSSKYASDEKYTFIDTAPLTAAG